MNTKMELQKMQGGIHYIWDIILKLAELAKTAKSHDQISWNILFY